MTSIADIKNEINAKLKNLYPKGEVDQFIFMIFSEVCKISRTGLIAYPDKVVSDSEKERILKIVARLEKFEPIQHILGYSEFYGNRFNVTGDVLIPRQETEELIDWILSDFQNKNADVVDIGTGSGIIAVSLKYSRPEWGVTAVDISDNALGIAKKNAELNNTDVSFIKDDALSDEFLQESNKFDVVISNPPYVRNLEKEEMDENVLDWEPHLALFVDDNDPLIFYRKIAEWAKSKLKSGGLLFYEINRAFGNETVIMLEQMGYTSVELRKDLFGNDRMIKACM